MVYLFLDSFKKQFNGMRLSLPSAAPGNAVFPSFHITILKSKITVEIPQHRSRIERVISHFTSCHLISPIPTSNCFKCIKALARPPHILNHTVCWFCESALLPNINNHGKMSPPHSSIIERQYQDLLSRFLFTRLSTRSMP